MRLKGKKELDASLVVFLLLIAVLVSIEQMKVYADDNDSPQIRWLDQNLREGSNRFIIAIKDESALSVAKITYTRYDAIFEEYDDITVGLTAVKGQPNMYYADIIVYHPQTVIELEVEDAEGNDDSERKTFDVSPTVLSVDVKPEYLTINDGDSLTLLVTNNHPYTIEYQIALVINGLSSDSVYEKLLSGEIQDNDEKSIPIAATIDQSDKNRPLAFKVTFKAFGLTKDFAFSDLMFKAKRTAQGVDEIKGRFERTASTAAGQSTLTLDVAKAVFILSPGEQTLTTPSGINLNQVFLNSPNGRWYHDTYLASDDTPIDFRGIKQVERAIYIVDVPEPGEYKANKGFVMLLRYYK